MIFHTYGASFAGERKSSLRDKEGENYVIGDDSPCGFSVGERVVRNGPHAEVVCVPKNLCAKVPDQVSDEEATFTVVGAIGLQGVRVARPTLRECFMVTGLGLILLLAVQILGTNGCRVFGIDIGLAKCTLARQFGAETVDLCKKEDLSTRLWLFPVGEASMVY